MTRSMAFLSGFPGGNCKLKHRRDFYDEKSMSETGAFALSAGSVLCGVCTGTSHRQFSLEQQRHIRHLSGVFPGDSGISLGAFREEIKTAWFRGIFIRKQKSRNPYHIKDSGFFVFLRGSCCTTLFLCSGNGQAEVNQWFRHHIRLI